MGFDPIWFGIVIVITVEMAMITPPVGLTVFAIKGVFPDMRLTDIFGGIWHFFAADLLILLLITIFPQIALFLPSLMK